MSEVENSEAVRTAIEEFNSALMKLMNVKGFTDSNLLLTDYVVITAQTGFNDKGDSLSAYTYILSDDEMAWHRIFGLLSITEKRLAKLYLYDDDDD